MSPGRADNLLSAAFVVLVAAFVAAAVTYEVPKVPFLVGLLLIGAAYLFVSFRYLDHEPAYTSKEDLEISERNIVFTDWLGEEHPIDLDRLVSITFTRYEALFPDPWFGDYMEEHLVLVGGDGDPVQIPLHVSRKHDLLGWLCQRFPDLDGDAAQTAVRSKDEGHWVLWRRDQRFAPES